MLLTLELVLFFKLGFIPGDLESILAPIDCIDMSVECKLMRDDQHDEISAEGTLTIPTFLR